MADSEAVGTLDDADTQVLVPEANGHTQQPTSVIEALRQQREQRLAERFHDFDVPGYMGLLSLRLGPIPGARLTALRERAERSKSPERDFNLNADTLIAACVEVRGRARTSDPFTTLPDTDGEPVRLDDRLATLLGFTADGVARNVVRALFSGTPSPDLAVATVANAYVEWASGEVSDSDDAYLGESPAARS
jgi:hypothetical protein